MRTAGEILREARNKKNLSLEEVERATKIRGKILQLLEEGNWNILAPTYIKGLLKNYASYLGLPEEKVLAFFRREYDEKKLSVNPKPPAKPRRWFRFTPTVLTIVLTSGVFAAIVFYLFLQYRSFTAPPRLEIQEPKDNIKIEALEVNIVGRTWSDATLKINGEAVQVSPGGTFSVTVGLKEGINTLTITAENRFGKISTATRTVRVESAKKPNDSTPANERNLNLRLEIITKSTVVAVEVDRQTVFQGLILVGSVKDFSAKEKIKIITEDGSATQVTIGDQKFILGKEGERVEREFTP